MPLNKETKPKQFSSLTNVRNESFLNNHIEWTLNVEIDKIYQINVPEYGNADYIRGTYDKFPDFFRMGI